MLCPACSVILYERVALENYAKGQHLTNIRHYIDDDESGRFFDRSAYSRMIEDVESGKIGVCIMKDLTRWGRDYLQVGNAMEIFRRNNVRFIAVNNGIDSENPDTLVSTPVRFCSFSPNMECRKMAGKRVQLLNNYTCRFRPSSLKRADKSGLDRLQAGK